MPKDIKSQTLKNLLAEGGKRSLVDIVKARVASLTGVDVDSRERIAVPKAGSNFK